jgi:hypothetical protein
MMLILLAAFPLMVTAMGLAVVLLVFLLSGADLLLSWLLIQAQVWAPTEPWSIEAAFHPVTLLQWGALLVTPGLRAYHETTGVIQSILYGTHALMSLMIWTLLVGQVIARYVAILAAPIQAIPGVGPSLTHVLAAVADLCVIGIGLWVVMPLMLELSAIEPFESIEMVTLNGGLMIVVMVLQAARIGTARLIMGRQPTMSGEVLSEGSYE